MSEFKTRISAQRAIVQTVNQKSETQLFGLSKKAIDRWADDNKISKSSSIYSLLIQASEKLFFLANKSQEQVTEDYKKISTDLNSILQKIEDASL
jgi:hypothetical protein